MSVSRIGVGAQAADIVALNSVTAAYPAAYSATLNDYALLVVVGKPTADSTGTPSAPAGYTLLANLGKSGQPIRIVLYEKVLDGSEATPPAVVIPSTDNWTNLLTAQLAIYRGCDPATPRDVPTVQSTSGAVSTWTPDAVTSATDAAMIVAMVGTADDNALGLLVGSEQGFSLAAGGASYDTTTGTDCAVAIADKIQTVAGLVTMPTFEETLVATDPWVGLVLALRPAIAAGGSTSAAVAAIEGY